jgi:hypothetical protein
MSIADELNCPSCDSTLDRREGPTGVSYQCLNYLCYQTWALDEVKLEAPAPAMTDPTERKAGELVERLREYADPDGRIPFQIVDQDGKRIGVARRTPDELLRSEAFVDDRGTAWMPPTAWAYFAACRARDAQAARIAALNAECNQRVEAYQIAFDQAMENSQAAAKARVRIAALEQVVARLEREAREREPYTPEEIEAFQSCFDRGLPIDDLLAKPRTERMAFATAFLATYRNAEGGER